MRSVVFALGLGLEVAACQRSPEVPAAGESSRDREAEACARCLAEGKTWQGSSGCTTNCAILDTSCFREACPGPCSRANCSSCFTRAACEAVACAWAQQAEAGWCREAPVPATTAPSVPAR